MSIRVVLVDDHPVLRAGVKAILRATADIVVVGEAGTGAEALALVATVEPTVVLLDMQLPDMNGVAVMRQIRAGELPGRVLVFSGHDDANWVREILDCGASGYLLKEEPPATLIEAIRGVAQGEEGWLSRRVAARMVAQARKTTSVTARLTGREVEVLRTVVTGKTNQEIGVVLGISEKTVEKHLGELFTKLGVSSRVGAAVRAVREDLV